MLSKKLGTIVRIGPKGVYRVGREKIESFAKSSSIVRGMQKLKRARKLRDSLRRPVWPQFKYQANSSLFLGWLTQEEINKVCKQYPEAEKNALIELANQFCDHVFDLLGSGPKNLGLDIDWHTDFKSGRTWPQVFPEDSFVIDLHDDSDIKVPWELSRHQHFVTLGQAYRLTKDEKYAIEFRSQLLDWVESNPYGVGVNWMCSMDVGLRSISWTWARMLFEGSPSLEDSFWETFYQVQIAHGDYVISHIEDWGGIKNNHYLSNGTALMVLGLGFPTLPGASAWREKGKEILEECMRTQVLDDGVDYEMSTAYHRLVTELLLTPALLAKRSSSPFGQWYWDKLEKMIDFTGAMTRPDGEIALFGDADNGRCQILSKHTLVHINDHRYLLGIGSVLFRRRDFAAEAQRFWDEGLWLLGPDALSVYEGLQGEPGKQGISKAFPKGGFYLMRNASIWAFADCGPRGIPNAVGVHGHNDALSFELSVNGDSYIVDSGTYVYSADPSSHFRLKGTRSHNVLLVDGREMAETPFDLWELGDEAQARVLGWEEEGDNARLIGEHYGYERFASPVKVRRTFEMSDHAFVVIDELDGSGEHDAELRFHSPVRPKSKNRHSFLLAQGDRSILVSFSEDGDPFCEETLLGQSYGVYRPGWVFGWRMKGLTLPWTGATTFCPEQSEGQKEV